MSSPVQTEVERVDRVVTAFLDEWTARTKRRHAVGDSLSRLERIMAEGTSYASLDDRLTDLAGWLDRYGDAVVDRGVHKSDLETLVAAAEQLVRTREVDADQFDGHGREQAGRMVERLVHLIRRGTNELGLEYTPAGLMETPETQRRESERARRSLLERLKGFEDVKTAYRAALEFQTERLEYFYQEDTHLLSVLDYQLRNLEARPNAEDEFFAACLLYYLAQHNYRIAPYLKRFKEVVDSQEALSVLEPSRS